VIVTWDNFSIDSEGFDRILSHKLHGGKEMEAGWINDEVIIEKVFIWSN